MPREYTPYCILECTFILSDPRYKTLPASAAKMYIALWARAFMDRRETLADWYDTVALQEDCRLDARTVRKAVAILQQRCLIKVADSGAITVCGVKNKGKSIKWKEGKALPASPHKSLPTPLATKNKRESKSKKESKSSAKPKKDTPAQAFVTWYGDTFEKEYGSPYPTNWAKDCSQAKAMLGQYDAETLKGLAAKMFASKDPWILGSSKSLGVFRSQLAKLIAAKEGNYDGKTGGRDIGRGFEGAAGDAAKFEGR